MRKSRGETEAPRENCPSQRQFCFRKRARGSRVGKNDGFENGDRVIARRGRTSAGGRKLSEPETPLLSQESRGTTRSRRRKSAPSRPNCPPRRTTEFSWRTQPTDQPDADRIMVHSTHVAREARRVTP